MSHDEIDVINECIKSRLTYTLIESSSFINYQYTGDKYLITHIDNVPVECPVNVTYVLSINGREEYYAFIEHCMRTKLIQDVSGVINTLMNDPESYPNIVEQLSKKTEYPDISKILREDKYFHVFGLLIQHRKLVFNV